VEKERQKIWGAPGTGKTTRLLDIVDVCLKDEFKPREIIYTSFTRASCNEAVGRAMTRFGFYDRKDFPYFRTEHALCYQLLGLKKGQVFDKDQLA